MTLEQTTQEHIQKALACNKLDVHLRHDFIDLLSSNSETDLDKKVLYSLRGTPNLEFPGRRASISGSYTAETTYRELLALIQRDDIYYAQKSRKLRKC